MDDLPLAAIPIFQTLAPEDRAMLQDVLSRVEISPGEVLIQEGEPGDCVYLVVQGELEVIKSYGLPGERSIGDRRAGDFVGEMSLLNPEGLRTASVVARSGSHLWRLDRGDFEGLLLHRPALAYLMLRELSRRLTDSHNASVRDLERKNQELRQAYEELQAAQAQLVEKEKLDHELRLAYNIQMSMLPRTLPKLAGFDFGARIQPARVVGGDLFDFIRLDKDRLGVVVGDVTDKGVPAAMFMAQIHALIRAEASPGSAPEKTLQRVNHHLQGMNANGLFVTVLYGVLEGKTGAFHYARAGHEAPFFVNPAGEVRRLPSGPSQPLGLFDSPRLEAQTLLMEPGSLLALFTDGVLDERSPEGSAFGPEGLAEALAAMAGKGAQQICDGILDGLRAYQGTAQQDDDITMVAIRH